jgi:hypothetical protein
MIIMTKATKIWNYISNPPIILYINGASIK